MYSYLISRALFLYDFTSGLLGKIDCGVNSHWIGFDFCAPFDCTMEGW